MAVHYPTPGSHDSRQPSAEPMRDATRYLAAAAYLSPSFRDTALHELIVSRHRAVAPSHGGVDVEAVLRHCLRARSFLLTREILLTVSLALGLVLWPAETVAWLAVALPFALLTTGPIRRLSRALRVLSWLILWVVFGSVAGLSVWSGAAAAALEGGAYAGVLTLVQAQVRWMLVAITALGVAAGYRLAVDRKLTRDLRPGALPPAGPDPNPRTEERLRWIRHAQTGSLTLYSGRSPFLGAGDVTRAWTIAVELDRTAGRPWPTPGARTSVERSVVSVDPVELREFVRRRLEQMSRAADPDNGIINLRIRDQVVVAGRFNQLHRPEREEPGLHPLVDPRSRLPYTDLSPPVIDALIRSPQAGARHYQRLDINSEGDEVLDPDGEVIIPPEDRGTSVTAFIHLAVEGRMMYTEFIITVLPPVHERYQRVDELPGKPGVLFVYHALRGQVLELFRDAVAAPIRLLRMGRQRLRDSFGSDDPARYTAYDYGARISLREYGAADTIGDRILYLDTFKYTKLVEERLTAAVLDFLEEKGVDTTAYRRQATAVSMSSTTHNHFGTYHNSQFGGSNSTFTQNIAPGAQEGQ